MATNPHTFQPLPDGAQACLGPAALHNPHCTGGSTSGGGSSSQGGNNAQQQGGGGKHHFNPGTVVMALVEVYFYFAVCQAEKEQNPEGRFAQNCWHPNWGPVTAPMPGEFSN